jgi:beta-lactamase regulating signal transducer with metallopeptidase domain
VWLTRKFGAEMLEAVLFLVCAISAMLILRRVYFGWKFESQRRKDRALSKSLHVEKLGSRYVDVYISKTLQGTPFTGGVFKPYICIPQPAFECLSNEELGAVIAHERAHIRYFDLPVTMVVQVLGDIYWFVPGYRWLSRKIDRMREVVADGWAVRSGIRPEYLASALVKLKELPQSDSKFILYSAFFREKSLLKIRVNTLLGESAEKESRFGWRLLWLRAVVSVSIFLTVMFTTFGGNQVDKSYRSSEWFLNLLKKAGWEVLSSDS